MPLNAGEMLLLPFSRQIESSRGERSEHNGKEQESSKMCVCNDARWKAVDEQNVYRFFGGRARVA